MSPSVLPQEHRHSWTEYQTWPDDEHWEIIDGVTRNLLSPAPFPVTPSFAGKECISLRLP